MDGAVIEADAMLAAGAMLTPGKRIPTGELWGGRPAKKMRLLNPQEIAENRIIAQHYIAVSYAHKHGAIDATVQAVHSKALPKR